MVVLYLFKNIKSLAWYAQPVNIRPWEAILLKNNQLKKHQVTINT